MRHKFLFSFLAPDSKTSKQEKQRVISGRSENHWSVEIKWELSLIRMEKEAPTAEYNSLYMYDIYFISLFFFWVSDMCQENNKDPHAESNFFHPSPN